MGPQQHLDVVQPGHLSVVDGDEPHLAQALTLHAVVHDVAQAVERTPLGQLLLGFLNGSSHAEAEAAAVVYLYLELLMIHAVLPIHSLFTFTR